MRYTRGMNPVRLGWRLLGMVLALTTAAHADWPQRVFAPYAYLTGPKPFSVANCCQQSQQKFFTLAFIIAGPDRQPRWDGTTPIGAAQANGPYYMDEIRKLRESGGDVIISFGGADGKELALVDADEPSLEAKYNSVILAYGLSWMDFDIEGAAVADAGANQRRTHVLADLQRQHPGLRISYTLAGDPQGLGAHEQSLLKLAKQAGLKVCDVNVMVMDFGSHWAKGRSESAVGIDSANTVHTQVTAIDPSVHIGLCPLIGVNDIKAEIFTQQDARVLESFANSHDWVNLITFWCANRDTGRPAEKDEFETTAGVPQKPWDFIHVFQPFERSTYSSDRPAH